MWFASVFLSFFLLFISIFLLIFISALSIFSSLSRYSFISFLYRINSFFVFYFNLSSFICLSWLYIYLFIYLFSYYSYRLFLFFSFFFSFFFLSFFFSRLRLCSPRFYCTYLRSSDHSSANQTSLLL